MAVMNAIQKAIDDLDKKHLASYLKSKGYKKKARTYTLEFDGNYRVINLQSGKWNDAVSGKFTFNLGVYMTAAQEATKLVAARLPPKEYECLLRERIGRVAEMNTDYWWDVDTVTDVESLAEEIIRLFDTHVLPWFAGLSMPGEIAEYFRQKNQWGMVALFLYTAGDAEGARKIIDEISETDTNEKRRGYWLGWAEKNHLYQ